MTKGKLTKKEQKFIRKNLSDDYKKQKEQKKKERNFQASVIAIALCVIILFIGFAFIQSKNTEYIPPEEPIVQSQPVTPVNNQTNDDKIIDIISEIIPLMVLIVALTIPFITIIQLTRRERFI